MTVSDWGSAAAPFGASGFQQGRPGQVNAQVNPQVNARVSGRAVHPAHGGPDPRYVPPMNAQRGAAAGYGAEAGYPAPQAYGTTQNYNAAEPAGAEPADAGPGYGHGYGLASGQGSAPGSGPGGSTALNVIGALLSVALVVGLGVWGYKLAVRDVTGVPVVKALEGPMRIQPEEPGGAVAPHQGLAVNDVAADGISAGPVDQLKLAPPVAELSDEDVPAHREVEVGRAAESPSTAPLPSSGGEINADAAVAEALGLTDIPGLDASGLDAPGVETPVSAPVDVIPESVPGVSRSPRPMPRPAGYAALPEITEPLRAVDVSASADTPAPARPADSAGAAPAVVLGQEVDPTAVDASARLVQLGAYPSVEQARAGWTEIANLNPELFQNRNWTIERRESGGAPFYRLRAIGFEGLQDARAFCAALIAAKGTCVPVIDTGANTGIDTATLAAPGTVSN